MWIILLQLPLIVQGISVIQTGIVELGYNITFSNHCQKDTHRIQVYHGGSIDDCVTECALRVHCMAINYHGGAGMCEIFREIDGEFIESGCSHIQRTDITVRKIPCYRECNPGMVCDIDTSTCVIKECLSFPEAIHGTVRGNLRATGTKVSIECDADYEHNDDLTHTYDSICNRNGIWDPHVHCRIVCGVLPTPQRVMVVSSIGTLDGDVTVYKCLTGNVHVEGTLIRVCQSNGTWSGSEPACNEEICSSSGSCFVKFPSTDLWGHDFASYNVPSFDDCAARCEDPMLKSIVYYQDGRCYCKEVTMTDGYPLTPHDCDFYHKQ